MTVSDLNTSQGMYNQLRNHIEKIVPLTDGEFTFVSSHFTVKRFRKHQFLVQVGELVPLSRNVTNS